MAGFISLFFMTMGMLITMSFGILPTWPDRPDLYPLPFIPFCASIFLILFAKDRAHMEAAWRTMLVMALLAPWIAVLTTAEAGWGALLFVVLACYIVRYTIIKVRVIEFTKTSYDKDKIKAGVNG